MLFVFSPKSPDCAVIVTQRLLTDAFGSLEPMAVIDRKYRHVNDLYSDNGIGVNVSEKKFVFAHGLPDGSALEGFNGTLLDHHWWVTDQQQFKLCTFYACHGSKFFSNQLLASKYHDWISYKDELLMLCGAKKISHVWEKLLIEFFKLTRDSANSDVLKGGMVSAYEKAILELESYDLGGLAQVTIIHLEWAIESLCSKSDVQVA